MRKKNWLRQGEVATLVAIGSLVFILVTSVVTNLISKNPKTILTQAAVCTGKSCSTYCTGGSTSIYYCLGNSGTYYSCPSAGSGVTCNTTVSSMSSYCGCGSGGGGGGGGTTCPYTSGSQCDKSCPSHNCTNSNCPAGLYRCVPAGGQGCGYIGSSCRYPGECCSQSCVGGKCASSGGGSGGASPTTGSGSTGSCPSSDPTYHKAAYNFTGFNTCRCINCKTFNPGTNSQYCGVDNIKDYDPAAYCCNANVNPAYNATTMYSACKEANAKAPTATTKPSTSVCSYSNSCAQVCQSSSVSGLIYQKQLGSVTYLFAKNSTCSPDSSYTTYEGDPNKLSKLQSACGCQGGASPPPTSGTPSPPSPTIKYCSPGYSCADLGHIPPLHCNPLFERKNGICTLVNPLTNNQSEGECCQFILNPVPSNNPTIPPNMQCPANYKCADLTHIPPFHCSYLERKSGNCTLYSPAGIAISTGDCCQFMIGSTSTTTTTTNSTAKPMTDSNGIQFTLIYIQGIPVLIPHY